MTDETLPIEACFDRLAPEWPEACFADICDQVAKDRTKIVILDDDPTGTQTVHDLPVLTRWDVASLKQELEFPGAAFFILTNSRSLNRDAACDLGDEIGRNLNLAAAATGTPFTVVSRSDSTLRGHFPHEVDALAQALGQPNLPFLICPFFLEGGRYTVNDIHYVAEGQRLVPAASTAYAQDAAFGFAHSNLGRWIEEKTKGQITAEAVVSVSIDDIRNGGPDRVKRILMTVPEKSACIINAVTYRDIEVVVAGLLSAKSSGKAFLCRTAASFVRVRAGVHPQNDFLTKKELVADVTAGGLFIVGSYVPITTTQVTALVEATDVVPIEIDVENVLAAHRRDQEVETVTSRVNAALGKGRDALVYTSRGLVTGNTPEASLKIGQAVSSSLIQLIKGLTVRPRYLVAKGGITSSDVATKGLKVRRAMIAGQVMPGVPVWKLGPESLYPEMSYVIFPGNVGQADALVAIQKKLSRQASPAGS